MENYGGWKPLHRTQLAGNFWGHWNCQDGMNYAKCFERIIVGSCLQTPGDVDTSWAQSAVIGVMLKGCWKHPVLQETNISPFKGTFEDDFPLSLEGRIFLSWLLHDCTCHMSKFRSKSTYSVFFFNLPSSMWQVAYSKLAVLKTGCPRQEISGTLWCTAICEPAFRLKKEGVGIVFCLQEDKASRAHRKKPMELTTIWLELRGDFVWFPYNAQWLQVFFRSHESNLKWSER